MQLPVPVGGNLLPGPLGSALAAAGGGRSLITYYDDATGDRVDLSAAMLTAWATRTANLLVTGCGIEPGGHVAMLLPAHWQTAAVLLGAWSAGASVDVRLAATVGLPQVGPGANRPVDAVFAALSRIADLVEVVPAAPARFALGPAAVARPLRQLPAGYRDFMVEAAGHDHTSHPTVSIGGADAATGDGTSYREWGALASALADRWGLRPGDRVLIDAATHDHPVWWLLAPLSAGATVVLCANLDPAVVPARSRAERVTRVL